MFKYLDRKQKNHIVLIPGWAFDHRIFATLELPYNYFFFCGDSIEVFNDELLKLLNKNNIAKISLFGFSRGALAACDFAANQPEMIEELILVGARAQYEKQSLENVKTYLAKNHKAFLYKFYRDCFASQEADSYSWFRDTLLKDYLERSSAESLAEGLAWLGQVRIDPQQLKKIKQIKLVHGKADAIAPFSYAVKLADQLTNAELIAFEHTSHLPFLREDFRERLYE